MKTVTWVNHLFTGVNRPMKPLTTIPNFPFGVDCLIHGGHSS